MLNLQQSFYHEWEASTVHLENYLNARSLVYSKHNKQNWRNHNENHKNIPKNHRKFLKNKIKTSKTIHLDTKSILVIESFNVRR